MYMLLYRLEQGEAAIMHHACIRNQIVEHSTGHLDGARAVLLTGFPSEPRYQACRPASPS